MNPIKILFICHGNICRSTMAQSVMQYLVNRRRISAAFQIDSAATSREEIGNPVHPGTVRKLQKENIPVIPHRAVQMTASDYEEYDYLIGMDSANLRNMKRIVGDDSEKKIFLLLEFAGEQDDIADPWYTGNFEDTYRDVRRGCEGLLAYLLKDRSNTRSRR